MTEHTHLRAASRWAGLAGAVVAATAALPALPASANDNGDSSSACNYYEICFSEYSSNWNQSHHDFYYDANHYVTASHGAYTFNRGTSPTGHRLMDAASGIWNRDSSCSVTLWDVDSRGVWFSIGTYGNGSSGWVSLNGNGNRNNGHSRCGNGSPVNK
jgi:hypothetical protein